MIVRTPPLGDGGLGLGLFEIVPYCWDFQKIEFTAGIFIFRGDGPFLAGTSNSIFYKIGYLSIHE